ncbi:MAG: DJ-1 family glyoxalase III [bacterium]
MKRAVVPIACGVEEMEAVITIDVLRRAGLTVDVAGLNTDIVKCSRGVNLKPDCALGDVRPGDYDILAIPGGMQGTDELGRDGRILDAIREFNNAGKLIGAICAAPLLLHRAGILQGRRITCHPSVAARLTGTRQVNAPVVADGNIITGQGAGTSFEFALEIVRLAAGEQTARDIARAICFVHM